MTLIEKGDFFVFSDSMFSLYLIAPPSKKWWTVMEEIFAETPVGTRILIRRDIKYSLNHQDYIVNDYIITLVPYKTCYGNWLHHHVFYRCDEPTPYNYDKDFREIPNSYISNNYNNYLDI